MTRSPQSVPRKAAEVRRVERAAATLSPIERQVLVLSARHGLRIHEIAARLGLSERRAERILARALRKFDRALEGRSPWRRFWSC